MTTSQEIWQKFEQSLARRERIRYLIQGRIKTNTVPNVLVLNDKGDWVLPSLKGVN